MKRRFVRNQPFLFCPSTYPNMFVLYVRKKDIIFFFFPYIVNHRVMQVVKVVWQRYCVYTVSNTCHSVKLGLHYVKSNFAGDFCPATDCEIPPRRNGAFIVNLLPGIVKCLRGNIYRYRLYISTVVIAKVKKIVDYTSHLFAFVKICVFGNDC